MYLNKKSSHRKASFVLALLLSMPFASRVLANEWTDAVGNGQTIGLNCTGTAGLLGTAACEACGFVGCKYAYSDSNNAHEDALLKLCLQNSYAQCSTS